MVLTILSIKHGSDLPSVANQLDKLEADPTNRLSSGRTDYNALMSQTFKPRILLLPLAAAIIAGLVWYRTNRPPVKLSATDYAAVLRRKPAEPFMLHDQHSLPFRLARYLGRHKLLIVFFDSTDGATKNPQLQVLKAGYEQLTAHGEKVIAISSATPYANRESFKLGGDFPFHILSDADYSVEASWGVMTTVHQITPAEREELRDRGSMVNDSPRVIPSAFVVDRAGVIHWSQIGGASPIPFEILLSKLRSAR